MEKEKEEKKDNKIKEVDPDTLYDIRKEQDMIYKSLYDDRDFHANDKDGW